MKKLNVLVLRCMCAFIAYVLSIACVAVNMISMGILRNPADPLNSITGALFLIVFSGFSLAAGVYFIVCCYNIVKHGIESLIKEK